MHHESERGYDMRLTRNVQTLVALGGNNTIGLILPDDIEAEPVFRVLWRELLLFEKRFSRFIAESELSQFNERAGMSVPVSDEFAAFLRTMQTLHRDTGGLFNPFVLPAVQRTGYLHSTLEPYRHEPVPDYRARSVVGMEKLELKKNWARIPYGTALDSSGCGKGYIADVLGARARQLGAIGYWIELSGDIATYGHDENGDLFTVAVQSAVDQAEETFIVQCPEKTFAVATSGTFARATHIENHHIIDPHTGESAETDIRLATVCADTALAADVFASCAIIVGSEAAPSFLEKRRSSAWLLQVADQPGYIRYVQKGSHIRSESGAVHA